MSSSASLYDEILYPGGIFAPTHPEHLATIASLYGMTPAPVDGCRVLELGCGFGANIVPMAFHYPQSEFIGIDLSGSSIARGQQNVTALGLSNIQLLRRDILDIGPDFGKFDYIISHGVYSWVPDVVRDKIFAIFKTNLMSQGVCYVSYNAYPYSHRRNLARDMALFHTRGITDARAKIAQARAILRFLSDASKADTVHGSTLRDQYERISKMSDEFFFHDDLNEIAEAFLLYQVVERAQLYGLQYLSDADFARSNLDRYPDKVGSVLKAFPEEEFLERDQYQDFIDGYGFRRTLLCNDKVMLQRTVSPDFVRRCYFTSASSVEGQSNLTDGSEIQFGTRDRSIFGISHQLVKAAYLLLGEAWPRALSFDELLDLTRAKLHSEGVSREQEDDGKTLAEAMYELACNDAISFSLYPRSPAASTPGKPLASLLARRQSETDTVVANLLHQSVRLEGREACRFLQLLDGTRDFEKLVAEVHAWRPRVHSDETDERAESTAAHATQEAVQNFLIKARKLGLLVQ